MTTNDKIIKILEELAIYSDIIGEEYRAKAYKNGIQSVKKLGFILNKKNVHKIEKNTPGIGSGIYGKIYEFITTGRVKALDDIKKSPHYKAWIELNKVPGVGPVTIKKWISMKILSVSDLKQAVRKGKVTLTHVQKLGLKYWKDLNEKIPRDEVTALSKQIFGALTSLDKNLLCVVLGSYRRGKKESGDIDILTANKDHYDEGLLTKFLNMIRDDEKFIDVLTAGPMKVSFLYKSNISGKVRQLDIFHTDYNSYYAFMLYGTGSAEHNAMIRGMCKQRGYRLNQNGLYKIMPSGKLQLVPLKSEEQLYTEILGIPYVKPIDR